MLKNILISSLLLCASTPLLAEITPPNPTNATADKTLEEGKKFLEENKKKAGVISLPSGLQYKIQTNGKGTSPGPYDYVKLKYRGTLIDGTVFESSDENNAPINFKMSTLIPGWAEALQKMKPGAKWILYVPPNLAFGRKGVQKEIPANATLIYELELEAVIPPPDNQVTDVLEDPKEET